MTHGRETQLLAQAYESLGYTSGVLLDAVEQPEDAPGIAEYWPDLGDWVRLGARVGAEKIFFVNSDPVILFQQSPGPIDRAGFREVYRKAWSMAGPRCLFLASPTELRVYALNRPPARWSDDAPQIQPLAIVERAADVADQLQAFARDQVESGALFADAEFGDGGASADRRLVEDLRVVRRALLDTGLAEQYTHALIARSVFIRYLEDRGILRDEYLTEIAQRSPRWNQLLQQSPQQLDLGPTAQSRRYDRVLRDRDFTYALFDKLSSDFQGDLLPKEELMQEYGAVTQAQLDLLRQFILGESDPNQPQLFIWAYDFRVIPISLISSI